jgi:hypothetical protein
MADTTTTNYSLTKPEVGASEDTWGTKLNTNLDTIDTQMKANADAAAAAINDVVDDTTPQLGGDLASNGNDILFADNDKAIFGAGSDLQIYHDGSNSYVKDAGTGNLRVQGDNILFYNAAGTEVKGQFNSNGACELYYDNSSKFVTTSSGVSVTGSLTASGDVTAYSDERLKTDIVTLDNALDTVSALRGVAYTKDGKASIGVIAQEVEAVLPQVVATADDEMQTKSVAYGNMVGLLIEAIKELKSEIEVLKGAK